MRRVGSVLIIALIGAGSFSSYAAYMAHCDTYRQQLGITYPLFGYALWEPTFVDLGDVGYIRHGKFHRLFNALLSADHPSHRGTTLPEHHEPLIPSVSDHVDRGTLKPDHYCSAGVTAETEREDVRATMPPDHPRVSFFCTRMRGGAVLSLPVEAQRQDTRARGDFGKWMVKHVDSWFAFARGLGLGIEQMEEIVLITGSHLTRSWANVAFLEGQANGQASFGFEVVHGPDLSINWHCTPGSVRGGVRSWGPEGKNLPEDQCVFIRGFRVTRVLGILGRRLRGAAGPDPSLDGNHDNYESDRELVSLAATKYEDPLQTLLDYIVERAPDNDMVLVHDDDLARIWPFRDGLDTLQPDALMAYLQKSQPGIQQLLCAASEKSLEAGAESSIVALFSEELQEWDLTPPRTLTGTASQKRLSSYASERMKSIRQLLHVVDQYPASKQPDIQLGSGTWNLGVDKLSHKPVEVPNWVVIIYESQQRFSHQASSQMVVGFVKGCGALGITINPQPTLVRWESGQGDISRQLRAACAECQRVTKAPPTLIVAVLPQGGNDIYTAIKHFGDVTAGITTQCMKSDKCFRAGVQYYANVALKINVKLFGTNVVPEPQDISILADPANPTIVMGADITPPSGRRGHPSFTIVVGSIDSSGAKYASRVRIQESPGELIEDMKDMCVHVFEQFRQATGKLPKRVLFYRDGVSEGGFEAIINEELPLIRNACAKLGFNPTITLIIVGKDHKIATSKASSDSSRNCTPGKVVDAEVVNPVKFDFYLSGQVGLHGTNKPLHYNILVDENKFTVDGLQSFSFALCHVHKRSVSIPAPVDYAHNVRTRFEKLYDPQQGQQQLISDIGITTEANMEDAGKRNLLKNARIHAGVPLKPVTGPRKRHPSAPDAAIHDSAEEPPPYSVDDNLHGFRHMFVNPPKAAHEHGDQ